MKMRIAIPVNSGELCSHFGRCEKFILFDIDPETREVTGRVAAHPPPHSPGAFPPWLAKQKVDLVIAAGMGPRAQGLLAQHGIRVLTGADEKNPDETVAAFLSDRLRTGENVCDH